MTIAFVILLILALVLWAPLVAGSASMRQSDAAGNALGHAFTVFYGIAVWVFLAVALLMAGSRGGIPPWAAICAFILTPASCAAAMGAIELLGGRDYQGKFLVIVPALAPPLLAAYAAWAFFPAFRAAIPSPVISAAIWGTLLILSILPWPTVYQYSRLASEASAAAEVKASVEGPKIEAERAAAELAEWKPKFDKLDPDAPLWEWMEFTTHGEELRRKAFEGARHSNRRQSDAEEMIGRGMGRPLMELANLDLEATPSLCEKARLMLQRNAKSISPAVPGRPYSWEKASIDPYLPALEWLLNHRCECMAEVAAIESAVREYPRAADRDQTLATLARLRRLIH